MVVTMSDATDQTVVKVGGGDRADAGSPPVEIIQDGLCSLAELRRAVVAGAIVSGVMGTIVGVGLGYLLGLQDRRR